MDRICNQSGSKVRLKYVTAPTPAETGNSKKNNPRAISLLKATLADLLTAKTLSNSRRELFLLSFGGLTNSSSSKKTGQGSAIFEFVCASGQLFTSARSSISSVSQLPVMPPPDCKKCSYPPPTVRLRRV